MHVLTQKRFEGLEEDKIAGFSNSRKNQSEMSFGLEEDKITWYSNTRSGVTVGRRFRRR